MPIPNLSPLPIPNLFPLPIPNLSPIPSLLNDDTTMIHMPPRRRKRGRKPEPLNGESIKARKRRRVNEVRQHESQEQMQIRLETDRIRHQNIRNQESQEQIQIRLETDRIRHTNIRNQEPQVQMQIRLEGDRI